MHVQTLLSARGILLKDLQNLSQAVNQPIDIKEIASNEIFGSAPRSDLEVPDPEVSGQFNNVFVVLKQYEVKIFFNHRSPLFYYQFTVGTFVICVLFLEQELNDASDFQNDVFLHALSEVKLLELIDFVGNQVQYLWGLFLNFHRFVLPFTFNLMDSICDSSYCKYNLCVLFHFLLTSNSYQLI